MATDDRQIDRKAETPTVEDDPDDPDDLRPDFDHFDTFRDHATGLRERIPDLRVPDIPVVAVVMASLYVFVAAGALSVGYGATTLAATHGGTRVGYIVGGVFVFGYGYVGLRFVAAATERPRP